MIGKTISHYRIVSKLGEGGMGVVYIAEDTVLGRQVAIKTLMDIGPATQRFRSRFLREARAVSALSHPHIATLHDYGETPDGQPYIVMELIKGEILSDLIHRSKLTLKRAVEIAISVAGALDEAHRHGIVHRDIKPSNIAINERGEVKVLDFGLAKQLELGGTSNGRGESQTQANTQTRDGVIVGTPMYVSPEQAMGVPVDARSDLFSLGSVLYECIAGHPAFPGVSAIDICTKVIRDDAPPPSQFNSLIPAELDRLILKALAKKPDERYQTASELIAGLRTVEVSLTDDSSTYKVTQRVHPRSRGLSTMSLIFSRPQIPVGYVVAGIIVLAVLAFGAWLLTRPKPHQPTAEALQFYEKGVSALQEGTYYKASINLRHAVDADDKFALAHARLAEAFAELDYTVEAKDEMLSARRVVADGTALDQIGGLYLEAIEATVTRKLPAAINAYAEIAKLKPREAEAYLDLGRAFENQDELDKAIEQYLRATSLDQNNPAPPLRLGVLYGRRQDLSKSNAAFDKAESLYKENQNFEGRAEVSYQRGYLLSQMMRLPEGRGAAEQSLAVAKLAENTYQQVRALLLLSTIAYSSGDTAQAQQFATRALELARGKGMENLTTQGLLDLGNALMMKGSYQESEDYLKQARDLAERFKEKRNQARANLLLGTLYIQNERTDQGVAFIEQAVAFYRHGGYRRELSRCMMITGRAQLLRGDFDGAVKTLDEQLQLAKQVEDPGQLASSQAEIASVLTRQDLFPQALLRHTESYESNKKIGDPFHAAFALLNRGDMLARLGRYDETAAALNELEPLLNRISNDNLYRSIWTGYSSVIRAQMELSQHRLAEARMQCQKVLAIVSRNRESLRELEGQVTAILGLIEVQAGNAVLGKKLCQKAIALANRGHEAVDTRLMFAQALVESGDADGLAAAIQAQENFARMRRAESEWRASLLAARANDQLGNTEATRAQLSRAKMALASIQREWGAEAFNSYATRPDIKRLLEQVSTLANR